MYPSSYHNTNKEIGATLVASEQQAHTQEELVLGYFTRLQGCERSAEQVHKALNLPNTPLTSIRRAITNLMKSGAIEKTNTMVDGAYGKKIHCYKLPAPNGGQFTLPI